MESVPLPNATDLVLIEDPFVAHDGKIAALRLRDQHAVEGIAMSAGKQTRSLAVFNGDGEFVKAELPDADGKVFSHLSRLGKFADPAFGGYFPGRGGADEHVGVDRMFER